MDECEFFNVVKSIIAKISESRLHDMLDQSVEIVEHIMRTRYYKQIEKKILDGDFPFPLLDPLLEDLSNDDATLIIWLTGYRVAEECDDIERVFYQICMFIAAQKTDTHRIKDDKTRLVLTHLHLQSLNEAIKNRFS